MSPWTVLGWALVALIVVPIAIRLAIGACELAAAVVRDIKRSRTSRRAHKGKVRCDFRGCDSIATRRGASGYCCEEHIGTYVTRRTVGMGATVSYATMLNHAKKSA